MHSSDANEFIEKLVDVMIQVREHDHPVVGKQRVMDSDAVDELKEFIERNIVSNVMMSTT